MNNTKIQKQQGQDIVNLQQRNNGTQQSIAAHTIISTLTNDISIKLFRNTQNDVIAAIQVARQEEQTSKKWNSFTKSSNDNKIEILAITSTRSIIGYEVPQLHYIRTKNNTYYIHKVQNQNILNHIFIQQNSDVFSFHTKKGKHYRYKQICKEPVVREIFIWWIQYTCKIIGHFLLPTNIDQLVLNTITNVYISTQKPTTNTTANDTINIYSYPQRFIIASIVDDTDTVNIDTQSSSTSQYKSITIPSISSEESKIQETFFNECKQNSSNSDTFQSFIEALIQKTEQDTIVSLIKIESEKNIPNIYDKLQNIIDGLENTKELSTMYDQVLKTMDVSIQHIEKKAQYLNIEEQSYKKFNDTLEYLFPIISIDKELETFLSQPITSQNLSHVVYYAKSVLEHLNDSKVYSTAKSALQLNEQKKLEIAYKNRERYSNIADKFVTNAFIYIRDEIQYIQKHWNSDVIENKFTQYNGIQYGLKSSNQKIHILSKLRSLFNVEKLSRYISHLLQCYPLMQYINKQNSNKVDELIDIYVNNFKQIVQHDSKEFSDYLRQVTIFSGQDFRLKNCREIFQQDIFQDFSSIKLPTIKTTSRTENHLLLYNSLELLLLTIQEWYLLLQSFFSIFFFINPISDELYHENTQCGDIREIQIGTILQSRFNVKELRPNTILYNSQSNIFSCIPKILQEYIGSIDKSSILSIFENIIVLDKIHNTCNSKPLSIVLNISSKDIKDMDTTINQFYRLQYSKRKELDTTKEDMDITIDDITKSCTEGYCENPQIEFGERICTPDSNGSKIFLWDIHNNNTNILSNISYCSPLAYRELGCKFLYDTISCIQEQQIVQCKSYIDNEYRWIANERSTIKQSNTILSSIRKFPYLYYALESALIPSILRYNIITSTVNTNNNTVNKDDSTVNTEDNTVNTNNSTVNNHSTSIVLLNKSIAIIQSTILQILKNILNTIISGDKRMNLSSLMINSHFIYTSLAYESNKNKIKLIQYKDINILLEQINKQYIDTQIQYIDTILAKYMPEQIEFSRELGKEIFYGVTPIKEIVLLNTLSWDKLHKQIKTNITKEKFQSYGTDIIKRLKHDIPQPSHLTVFIYNILRFTIIHTLEEFDNNIICCYSYDKLSSIINDINIILEELVIKSFRTNIMPSEQRQQNTYPIYIQGKNSTIYQNNPLNDGSNSKLLHEENNTILQNDTSITIFNDNTINTDDSIIKNSSNDKVSSRIHTTTTTTNTTTVHEEGSRTSSTIDKVSSERIVDKVDENFDEFDDTISVFDNEIPDKDINKTYSIYRSAITQDPPIILDSTVDNKNDITATAIGSNKRAPI